MGLGRIAAILVVSSAVPCVAQTTISSLSLNAGSATDIAGNRSSAISASPSLMIVSPAASLSLGATGTRFANEAWSAGLASGASARRTARSLRPALDVSASATTTSYDLTYLAGDFVPSLELHANGLTLFAGARVAAASLSQRVTTGPVGSLPTSTSRLSSSARTWLGGGSYMTVSSSGQSASFAYRLESGRVANEMQTDHTLSISTGTSAVTVAGSLGLRTSGGVQTSFGNGVLSLAVSPMLAVQVAAGGYPANPMLRTPAGSFINAGLVMRLGRGLARAPEPASVPGPARGMTRLAIRANEATRVELAGDFTKWKPVTTTRATNGVWYVDLDIPPGEYRYAFRIDGREWRVPEGVAAADDGFGGKSAWLTVKTTDARRTSK